MKYARQLDLDLTTIGLTVRLSASAGDARRSAGSSTRASTDPAESEQPRAVRRDADLQRHEARV